MSEPGWHGDVRCRIYVYAAEVRLEASGALRAMGYVPYMARKDDELATLEIDQPVPAAAWIASRARASRRERQAER